MMPLMNDPLLLFGLSTTPLELISFVLSLVTVGLNIRQSHWGWLFAIISSATYAVVFFGAKLYGDMGLQVVFIIVSFWGWYQWLHGGAARSVLQVSRLSARGWRISLLAWALGFVALAFFLGCYTDTDVPRMDGFLTAGSLLAQVMMSRKKLENWLIWIAVDVLYIGLYLYKQLLLTAGLYALFIGMAAIGYVAWKKTVPANAVDGQGQPS
jgi:nicotinamide mononucleotide transporter